MRILLDHCVDRRIAPFIVGHEVVTTRRMGWTKLQNGALLTAAEAGGFDLLLTVDKNLCYQQSMARRMISVVNFASRYVDAISLAPSMPALLRALDRLQPGAFVVISPPEGPSG